MVEFKLVIGDPKSRKCYQKVVQEDNAKTFLRKKIGDKIKGESIDMTGYEFEITGGADYCGFPMRRDIDGPVRKKIMIINGVGIRNKDKGLRKRKTVCGNTIHEKITQICLKVIKHGKTPLEEPTEGEAPKGEAKKQESKAEEKPKETPDKEEKTEKKEHEQKTEHKEKEKPEEKKETEKAGKVETKEKKEQQEKKAETEKKEHKKEPEKDSEPKPEEKKTEGQSETKKGQHEDKPTENKKETKEHKEHKEAEHKAQKEEK